MSVNPNPPNPGAAAPGSPRFVVTQNGPMFLPAGLTDEQANQAVEAYDRYIATLTRAWQESSGLQRTQIEAQIEDAKKARANAMEIARIQSGDSRYGTDTQRRTRLDELQQNQRQFDATHALDMQRYGLDVANSYVKYASTPDMRWSANDFDTAVARTGVGGFPQQARAQAPAQPKTWESWAALSGYNTPVVNAGAGGGSGGGGGAGSAGGAGAGGGSKDLRMNAAQAVMKAMPPSDGIGHDAQDWAALDAVKNLYFSGRPGEVERLGAPRRKIAQAGLARLGYDPALVESDRQRALPGQASVRRA